MKIQVTKRSNCERPIRVQFVSESTGKASTFYLTKDEAMTLARALSVVSLDVIGNRMLAKR